MKTRDNKTMNRSAGVLRFLESEFNPGTRLSRPLSGLSASIKSELKPTDESQNIALSITDSVYLCSFVRDWLFLVFWPDSYGESNCSIRESGRPLNF